MARYDLVIRGGTLVDGSGGDPYEADVAIAGGKIAEIGKLSGAGAEEIDAKGLLVTPGFVDIHTHFDGQITWADRLSPSSEHGVTTVMMGNCGVGFAPCRPEEREMLLQLMEGVEDIPEIVMQEGIPWNWQSFPEYLAAVERRPCDMDFAALVPHAPVRVHVMGQRGAAREPATAKDIAAMAAIVRDGVLAGALGFSTTRSLNHRSKDGNLAPTITAGEEELRAIAMGLAGIGKGILQMANQFIDANPDESSEFAMVRRIARESGRTLTFSISPLASTPDRWRQTLRMVEQANREGTVMVAQVTGRPIGVLMGLDLSMHPFSSCPSYQAIAHLPLSEKVRALRDPALRARLLGEEPQDPNPVTAMMVRSVPQLYELGDPPDYEPPAEASLKNRAQRRGVTAKEVAYDILLERDGHSILYYPSTALIENRLDNTLILMRHPNTVLGVGDGGAHLGQICDASMPTYLLTHWVRDRKGGRLTLPEAVRTLTRDTAAAVGLGDRGLLAPGYKADVNVIDHARMKLHAPHPVYDLPTGARRLTQSADGYVATMVSGTVTYREGKATGALPGRLIRGAQAAPHR